MDYLVQSPRPRVWLAGMAAVLLLTLCGCGDTAPSNHLGGDNPGGGQTTPGQNTTPGSIPGWQTYKDPTYAYTIQYPPNWKAILEPQPSGAPYEVVGFFAVGADSGGAPPKQNIITITVTHSQPDTVDTGAPPGFGPIGPITVAGTTQQLLSGPGSEGGQGLVVLFAQTNELYLFYSTADTASADLFLRNFTQMIATFKLATTSS